jgi:pilus assembly protein Flp/PilA
MLTRFYEAENGATAIEYGLIAAFIGIAIINVLQGVGQQLVPVFSDVETGLKKRPAP